MSIGENIDNSTHKNAKYYFKKKKEWYKFWNLKKINGSSLKIKFKLSDICRGLLKYWFVISDIDAFDKK